MARLRYVRSLEQIKQAREADPEFLPSTVRSVRCVYETDAKIARALLPKPLEPAAPEVCVTFSHVAMHVSPERTIEIGSAIFGVTARYDGVEGKYLVTMPMTTEQAVIGGRETYGEPKKIAQIAFAKDGARVSASVTRMGMTYLEGKGTVGAPLGAREFSEFGYCYKALPSCVKGEGFDGIRCWCGSSGGATTASGARSRASRSCASRPVRRRKPIVVSMVDVAASGGYMMAFRANRIVALPTTITGSIGILSEKFNMRGFYDKIGLSRDFVTRGSFPFLFSDYHDGAPPRKV